MSCQVCAGRRFYVPDDCPYRFAVYCYCFGPWNAPECLPPVDCPLVLLVGDEMVKASRTSHLASRGDQMDYRKVDGTMLTGRYRWQYA